MINKVLVIGPNLSLPGGVSNIYKYLELHNYEGIRYYSLKNYLTRNVFRSCYSLVKFFLTVNKYDLIHVNPSFNAPSLFRDSIYILIAKLFNKRVLVFFHGWEEGIELKVLNLKLYNFVFRFVMNKTDGFILLGEIFAKKLISLGISPVKMIFFLPTVANDNLLNNCTYVKTIDRKANTIIKLLFLSRLDPNKGLDIAMETMISLNRQGHLNFELIIAGDGVEYDRWHRFIIENGLNNVHMVGYAESDKKHKLLLDCDLLFFPTCYGEGLPCVIMEAMLYGLPIITRNVGAISEWVLSGKNGFITQSIDPGVFANYILILANDKALYDEIVSNNLKVASENFTPRKVRANLFKIYDIMLELDFN